MFIINDTSSPYIASYGDLWLISKEASSICTGTRDESSTEDVASHWDMQNLSRERPIVSLKRASRCQHEEYWNYLRSPKSLGPDTVDLRTFANHTMSQAAKGKLSCTTLSSVSGMVGVAVFD